MNGVSVLGLLALLAELALRLFAPPLHFPLDCAWRPQIGCVLTPNVRDSLALGHEIMQFSSNAEGRRDDVLGPKPRGVRRVLLLGDGVTWGVRLQDSQTIAAQMSQHFKNLHQSVQVLNGGSLWLKSTEQQLAWFLDIGQNTQPDEVILLLVAKNDLTDNARQEYFGLQNGQLQRRAAPNLPLRLQLVLATADWPAMRWLDAHSRLFAWLRLGFWSPMARFDRPTGGAEMTAALLAQLQKTVQQNHARLRIALVPAQHKLQQEQELLAIAHKLHLDVLDLTADLAATPEAFFADGHPTPAGAAAIAAALTPHAQK